MPIKRFLNWLVGLPIAAAAIVFAVANRQWVVVSFDPFDRETPFAAVGMPLWVVFFCGIFAGLMVGWIAAWFAQGKWRRAARDARVELVRHQHEYDRLKREAERKTILPGEDQAT